MPFSLIISALSIYWSLFIIRAPPSPQTKFLVSWKQVFVRYVNGLKKLEEKEILSIIKIPEYNTPNYHIFYFLLNDVNTRDSLLSYLKNNGIGAVFHYIPLHTSIMGEKLGYKLGDLPVSESVSERLIRLPIFASLTDTEVDYIIDSIYTYFKERK